jgi:hypothetical protein
MLLSEPQALELLRHAGSVASSSLSRVRLYLEKVPPPQPRCRQMEDRVSLARPQQEGSGPGPSSPPVVWARPGAIPVLSRPILGLKGRRHVPHLVTTMNFPFLRIKKPQSPYLSRVIRNKKTQWQRRITRLQWYEEQEMMASDEDVWDSILAQDHGVVSEEGRGPEQRWASVWRKAIGDLKETLNEVSRANTELSRRMWDIVKEERRLAAIEEAERQMARKGE